MTWVAGRPAFGKRSTTLCKSREARGLAALIQVPTLELSMKQMLSNFVEGMGFKMQV